MNDNDVKAILAAVGTEVLSRGGAPLPTAGGLALALGGPWIARKVEDAVLILKERFRTVQKILSKTQEEEFLSMFLRYIRSAQEGAARKNLHLMADVMAGMIERDAIYADDFLREASVLSELSGKEIIILGSI